MRRILPLAALLIALMAGCGSDDGSTTSAEPRVPGPSDSVVVFERSGGIDGRHQRLIVRPDGAARVESGGMPVQIKRFKLSAQELTYLRAARDHVDFTNLEKSYGPEQPVADGIASTVRVDGNEVTVLTEGDPPAEVEDLITTCAGIVTQHAPR
jgi:hypothetical protein